MLRPDGADLFICRKLTSHGFGQLREERLAVVALTVIAVGAQIFFTSFLLSVIGLRRGGVDPPPKRRESGQ